MKPITTPRHSEILRKLIHLIYGFFVISILFFSFYSVPILGTVLLSTVIASVVIKRYQTRLTRFKLFGYYLYLEREWDLTRFPLKGIITFTLGSLLTILFFERRVALASLVLLTVGDATSHIIGRYYGKVKIFNNLKNIEGTFVAILLCMLINFFIIHYIIAFVSAILTLFLEAYEVKIGKHYIDDNLYIPLVAGLIITSMQVLL